jgi:site-specific recombinase XerD
MRLPRVHRVTKGDVVYKYHRRTRRELPRDVPEDHPAFVAAWLAEEQKRPAGKSRALSGSVAKACEAYLASRSYEELSKGYRPTIRRHVEAIRSQGEQAMLADLRPKHIRANLEPLTPAVAMARMSAWKHMAAFWIASGMIDTNPTDGVKRKKLAKSGGHKEWTQADVEAFRAHWGLETPQRLAFELLQWTGARISDVARLGPQMVGRDGLLTYTQQKTGNPAHVPWTCPAFGMEHQRADLLKILPTGALVYVVSSHGGPRSRKAMSDWFSSAARAAGLDGLTGHGLRKYRLNTLAEHGASVLVMQSWCGHVTLAEVQHYTKKADRKAAMTSKPRRAEA